MCWDPSWILNLAWAVEKASLAFLFFPQSPGLCFLSYLQGCFQPRERQSSINIGSPDTALCQTPQDVLYQPLNLVYVSGRSQTRKTPPIHQVLLLLLFGKTTLNSKNKRIWGSFSWRWKDTKQWAGSRKMVMTRKGDNLYKKISISDVDDTFGIKRGALLPAH